MHERRGKIVGKLFCGCRWPVSCRVKRTGETVVTAVAAGDGLIVREVRGRVHTAALGGGGGGLRRAAALWQQVCARWGGGVEGIEVEFEFEANWMLGSQDWERAKI
jgi:hypothetical protein